MCGGLALLAERRPDTLVVRAEALVQSVVLLKREPGRTGMLDAALVHAHAHGHVVLDPVVAVVEGEGGRGTHRLTLTGVVRVLGDGDDHVRGDPSRVVSRAQRGPDGLDVVATPPAGGKRELCRL